YRDSGGEALPVFNPSDQPLLSVRSVAPCAEGELCLFLLGGDLRTLALPAGDGWGVAPTDLHPGCHVLDVLHRSTDVAPVRLAFWIGEDDRPVPSCHVEVRLNRVAAAVGDTGELTLATDLAALSPEALEVLAPPLWPVELRWEGARRDRLGSACVGADGRLPGEVIFDRLKTRREEPSGDLWLDLAELGRVVIRHDRQPAPGE